MSNNSQITKADIIKIAQISYINLSDIELDKIFKQIDAVLNYASFLKDIAKTVTGPAANRYSLPTNSNIMREDVISKSHPQILLNAATDRQEDYFVVPLIIKQD